jgi:hypothetical protein
MTCNAQCAQVLNGLGHNVTKQTHHDAAWGQKVTENNIIVKPRASRNVNDLQARSSTGSLCTDCMSPTCVKYTHVHHIAVLIHDVLCHKLQAQLNKPESTCPDDDSRHPGRWLGSCCCTAACASDRWLRTCWLAINLDIEEDLRSVMMHPQ